MKINKKIIFLLLFVVFWGVSAKSHPFYVSLCQVDYNLKSKSLEISLKIFADDLILALEEMEDIKLFLGEENENPSTNTLLVKYLKENLQFYIDDEVVSYNFIGKELEKDVVWTYLEIENIDSLSLLAVKNSLLIDVLPDQKNMVQVNNKGKIKNLLLNSSKTEGRLKFDEE